MYCIYISADLPLVKLATTSQHLRHPGSPASAEDCHPWTNQGRMPQARWEQFEIKAGNSSMRDLNIVNMLNSDFEFKNLIQFKNGHLQAWIIYSTYTVIYVSLSCGIGNLIHDQKRLQAHVARRKCRFLRRCRCWHLLYMIYQVDVIDVMKNMNSNLPQQKFIWSREQVSPKDRGYCAVLDRSFPPDLG